MALRCPFPVLPSFPVRSKTATVGEDASVTYIVSLTKILSLCKCYLHFCMSPKTTSSRQRLIDAALQLFVSQGVTATTTRQIAELADVNEVTLFRQFGNKHGLLLAVVESAQLFPQLGQGIDQPLEPVESVSQALHDYAAVQLQALQQAPELVRSLIGEAGQYSADHAQVLGQSLTRINDRTAEYLAGVLQQKQMQAQLSSEQLASLLNALLLGYSVVEVTTQRHQLWQSREAFLQSVVALFLQGATRPLQRSLDPSDPASIEVPRDLVEDLPALLVDAILQRAKKSGLQDYALAYLLFAAGLSAAELVTLQRNDSLRDAQHHLLQLDQGRVRQVPVNQWILGQRYGSYTRNPLTQWLKSRKDERSAMFCNELGEPISEAEVRSRWHHWTEELSTPTGQTPAIEQAQQTWRVEMLMKGMGLEDLSLLTGLSVVQLQPYADRAREKAALEQAVRLDHKPGK